MIAIKIESPDKPKRGSINLCEKCALKTISKELRKEIKKPRHTYTRYK